jgi:hypothetical protein
MLWFVRTIGVRGFKRYFVGSRFEADLSGVKFGSGTIRDFDHQDETRRIRPETS